MDMMPYTCWFKRSMVMELLWFRCGPSADDALPMTVLWWKHLWNASWKHLNSKYVAFVWFGCSFVGLSFGWLCVCLSCCGWVDDLHMLFWCIWSGKYDLCKCCLMYCLWSELISNLENGWRLEYSNDFDYLVNKTDNTLVEQNF